MKSSKYINNVTYVCACKGRGEFLKETLPFWLEYDFRRFIVLDWGDPEGFEWLPNHPRIELYEADPEETNYFNRSVVWNTAIGLVETEYYFKVDCDVYPGRDVSALFDIRMSDSFLVASNSLIIGDPDRNVSGSFGTHLAPMRHWQAVNGYDERMLGWGLEDDDYYMRLMKSGLNMKLFSTRKGSFIHIPHSDDSRVAYHKEKQVGNSRYRNIAMREYEGYWTPSHSRTRIYVKRIR